MRMEIKPLRNTWVIAIKVEFVMRLIAVIFLLASTSAFAGGWSNWASPTQVDMERGNGIMVYGNFGNPSECTVANRFYVPKSHPEYDKIYGVILAAFTAQKQLLLYSHTCNSVGWYSTSAVTYNIVTSGAVNIKH
jgi:hypothetical protein